MEKQLFRKTSMDKISSPEQLNDYIKVTNPGIWLILSAIVLTLVGLCIWGIFGKIITTVSTVAEVKNGKMVCFVREEDASEVRTGMKITVDDQEYTIEEMMKTPSQADQLLDAYAMHVGNLEQQDWVYQYTADTTLQDGIYQADIITDSVTPASFIMN